MRRLELGLGLICVLALAAPAPLVAQDCPTWLPDFGDCDREARFPGFVAPVTASFQFEEPFVTTGLSAWVLWNDFPESGVFEGGDLIGYAAQVRVALSDRLGLIATKDGRITLRPDNDLLDTETGYADLGLGIKYVLLQDRERGLIVTPSLRYELSQGSNRTLGGNGDGVWLPGISAGFSPGDFRVLAGATGRLPVDGNAESTAIDYHLHVSRAISERLTPFFELNGISYLDSGNGSRTIKLGSGARVTIDAAQTALGLSAFEGNDLVNLGSKDVDGHDVFSWAVGLRARLAERVSLGLAYERPLTKRRDILKQRVTLNILLEM